LSKNEIKVSGRIGNRRYVEMAFDCEQIAMTVEWDPGVPASLLARELRDYRRLRDRLVADIEQRIGGKVAVMEMPPS